jgi:hypothetical protein
MNEENATYRMALPIKVAASLSFIFSLITSFAASSFTASVEDFFDDLLFFLMASVAPPLTVRAL